MIGHSESMDTGFQSTLPVRGATAKQIEEERDRKNFNPRSPCGERQ